MHKLILCSLLLLSACKKNPKNTETLYYQQALLEIKDGNHHKAINLLEQTLKRNPENIKAAALQGNLFYLEKNYQEAEKVYRQAISKCKDEALKTDILNNLACTLVILNQLQEAQNIWQNLTNNKYYSTPEVAYFNLGFQEFRAQNFLEAKNYLAKSIEIQPSYTDARWYLTLTLYYLKDYQEAKLQLDILKLQSHDSQLLNNLENAINA